MSRREGAVLVHERERPADIGGAAGFGAAETLDHVAFMPHETARHRGKGEQTGHIGLSGVRVMRGRALLDPAAD